MHKKSIKRRHRIAAGVMALTLFAADFSQTGALLEVKAEDTMVQTEESSEKTWQSEALTITDETSDSISLDVTDDISEDKDSGESTGQDETEKTDNTEKIRRIRKNKKTNQTAHPSTWQVILRKLKRLRSRPTR